MKMADNIKKEKDLSDSDLEKLALSLFNKLEVIAKQIWFPELKESLFVELEKRYHGYIVIPNHSLKHKRGNSRYCCKLLEHFLITNELTLKQFTERIIKLPVNYCPFCGGKF